MQSATTYVNIAAYKFVTFDNTEEMRPQYQAICAELSLKGTILLTPEGINMFLSGTRENIDTLPGLAAQRRALRRYRSEGKLVGRAVAQAHAGEDQERDHHHAHAAD